MRSMFARLITVFLVAVLVSTVVIGAIYYASAQQNFYDSAYNYLISQAQNLAFLAGSGGYNVRTGTSYTLSTTNREFIKQITQQLFRDYNAYCIIVDRNGQKNIYLDENFSYEDLQNTLDTENMEQAISAVLDGQEVLNKVDTPDGTMFTVAIPWRQNNRVMGAVVIQTAAHAMRSAFLQTNWPVFLVSVATILISAVLIFLMTRSIVRPLTQMEHAANALAEGNFATRAEESGSRETVALARAFNGMAVQLEELENSRREFLANVSHELRSPITSIQGYMQSMLDDTIPQTEHKKYMETVLSETKRLSRLINSLLNLSRMERDEVKLALTDFDLNELTRRVLITKMQQIEDNEIELEVDFAQDPCYARADSEQITQVLVNLVDNALKFTPKGGRIGIRSRIEKDLIHVIIWDNGEKVSPEDAPHLFDRFYKADKAHTVGKGTGLGLAICKRIMEKHGQKIFLVPSDEGAAFEFTLEKGKAPALPNGGEQAALS